MKMMNIVISGYGKMGKAVEDAALQQGHNITAVVDKGEDWEKFNFRTLQVDVVIDFSLPETAVDNIIRCANMGIPIVTGTTGWYKRLDEVKAVCEKLDATLFYAPNFSVGVNVFFKANLQLARLMNNIEGYDVSVSETHHVQKMDAPSGTAIKAAEDILSVNESLKKWAKADETESGELPVFSSREGEVPGTHETVYESEVDRIVLKHEAKSRAGFALGALMAAGFVQGRRGVFTMDDLLKG